jgi:hypothetical protein
VNVGYFRLNNPPPIEKFETHDLRRTVATMIAVTSAPSDRSAYVTNNDPTGILHLSPAI